ncbi:pyocin knob domain-containing protein [Vibrio parahaemolyticus]|uniref:pyocin knob domain-containing protein n=1 Tax=Vibrio parahaemolyticus TaxID=670 RepID=UPI0038916C34
MTIYSVVPLPKLPAKTSPPSSEAILYLVDKDTDYKIRLDYLQKLLIKGVVIQTSGLATGGINDETGTGTINVPKATQEQAEEGVNDKVALTPYSGALEINKMRPKATEELVDEGLDDSAYITAYLLNYYIESLGLDIGYATVDKDGLIRLATSTEAINGTDATKALTPSTGLAQLKSRISSALNGTRTDYSASEDALRQVNEKADAAIPQIGGSTITTENWNDIISPGAYVVSNASGDNRPSAYNYGTLFVLNTKTTIVQIYYSDQAFQMLSRAKWSSNNWGSWEHVGGASQSPNSALNLNTNNLNSLDGSASYTTAQFGFFYQDVTANATEERNYPEQEAGMLIISKSAMIGGSGCIQTYITRSNNIYTRSLYVTWSEWVKTYSTNNKPTPDDVGALTGQTVVASWSNQGKWIKIATAYLPSSSSVASIDIYGGGGFNAGLNSQSSKHQIIVRAGNSQGEGNCRLYTQSFDTCPFDSIGFVHTGSSQFDIYAKSRHNYSAKVLVEYASTHGITPMNEVLSETPSGLYEGDVVIDYNSGNPPTLADIGIEHIGKSVVGNEADEESIDIAGTSYYLTKYVTSYDPNSLIINSIATTGVAEIKHDGYYLLRYTVNRIRQSEGSTVQNGYIEIDGDFVAQNEAVSNDFAAIPITTEYYGALLAGDLIRYLTLGSSLADGGSFSIEYKRALSESERLLAKPNRAQDAKMVAALMLKQSRNEEAKS